MRKKSISGIVLIAIGFILSPLSWWNDAFVNFPIAYLGGWLASEVHEKLFIHGMLFSYWLTNILGVLMLHRGALLLGSKKQLTKRAIITDILISVAVTLLIVALAQFGFLRPPHFS